jgi:hypothetical protein
VIDGMDCTCAARSEDECGCDADWTTQEVADLREEVKQLREAAVALDNYIMNSSSIEMLFMEDDDCPLTKLREGIKSINN